MNIAEEYKRSLKMPEVEELLDLLLYRPLALVFVRLVYRTPITPNGVTVLSLISGLASAASFSQGTAGGFAWGGIWYGIANMLDCSDGQLARLQNSGTPLGRLVDGVVDWTVSIAIFVGVGIGLQASTGDSAIWYLVIASGITSAVHSFYFDLYQQHFISAVRGGPGFLEQEREKIAQEQETLRAQGGRRLKERILHMYVSYLEAQRRSRPPQLEGRQYPPDLYRSFNRNVMRFWTILGPTTNRSLLMLAGLLNNLSIFLWPVVTIGNILLVVALVWQRKATQRLSAAAGSLPSPSA